MNLTVVTDVNKGPVPGFRTGQNLGNKVSFREKFDVAVARAVAEMRILAGCCLYLVRDGGLFIAAKGYDPQFFSHLHDGRGTSCFTMASSMPVVRASLSMTAIDLSIQLFKFFVSLYTQVGSQFQPKLNAECVGSFRK
ncbi:hypothetical protein NC651_033832 [Populus alba x Populus x berolinensis]|nr:hypothetical protein NC651_033832 [Populus alba x Populus x berolinensis]